MNRSPRQSSRDTDSTDSDDRSARLPRAVRDASVTGSDNANDAGTTTDPAATQGKRRSGGPGGYAPTVVPDNTSDGSDDGTQDDTGDGKTTADSAEDRRRPPPLQAQGVAWGRDAQATTRSLAGDSRRPTKENP